MRVTTTREMIGIKKVLILGTASLTGSPRSVPMSIIGLAPSLLIFPSFAALLSALSISPKSLPVYDTIPTKITAKIQ